MTEVKTEEKIDNKKMDEKKTVAVSDELATEEEISVEIDISKLDKNIFFEAVGRRKTSIARVRLYVSGKKEVVINNKPHEEYFSTKTLQETCIAPLKKTKFMDKFRILVVVSGGGISSQAEAVRHGISRALVLFNLEFKKRLRRAGFLTRDPRQRERKKFGLKRARRAPQWKKR